MQTPSATLSGQFQANLGQYQDCQLTRELVYQVASATFDHYFSHRPTVAPTVAIGGGKKVSTVPDQWSRILNSKEYGVCAFPEFKAEHEEMKKARPGLNYFTAVSEIRTKYEGTPHWQSYLSWVRARHPHKDAVANDPSPRKTVGGVAIAPAATAPTLLTAVPVVSTTAVPIAIPAAIPAAVPVVPTSVAVPVAVPVVPTVATEVTEVALPSGF